MEKVKRNIKPFNGEKYSVWKFRIRTLLSELNLLSVIDEEIPGTRSAEWEKNNKAAKSIIVEYLADSYLNYINENGTAQAVFKHFDAIYERKSVATQLALRKQLLGLKLKADIPLIKHFSTFDDLLTELSAAGAKLEETDKVAHLLLTLPNTYDGVITAIETLSEENITLGFVKTRLLDHEVKLKNESRDTSLKILHVEEKYNKNRYNRTKQNYLKNTTFKKTNKQKFVKCHYCGRKGHKKQDCFYFKRQTNIQNNAPERTRQVQTIALQEGTTSNSSFSGFAFMTSAYHYEKDHSTIKFLLDSGASDHITNRDDLFTSFECLNPPLKISVAKNNTFISATKRGNINLISQTGVQGILTNVLFCAEVPYNLISVSKMQQAGFTIIFDDKGTQITKEGKIIMKGKTLNNLIVLEFKIPVIKGESASQACYVNENKYELWHQRLGHISKTKFLQLKCHNMIDDLDEINTVTPNDKLCEACINGKQTRLPFNKVKDKSYIKRPLFIVHSDVCGPITPPTIDNRNYFVLFVDEYTHYCVVYMLTYKSEVFTAFKDYVAKSEAKFNFKVVNLYSDNGGEYLSTEMKNYCRERGISYHLTVPRTPQLNGVAERMVRTITEKARAMLNGTKASKRFWGNAVLTAVYLINITPTKALSQSKTPYEMWHDRKPSVKNLRVFGSTVYVHNKTSKNKFDNRSWKGILVGYEPNGYKVWNTEFEKYETVRDVVIDETNFIESRPSLRPERSNNTYSQDETDNDSVTKSVSYKSHSSGPKSDSSQSDECSTSKIRKIGSHEIPNEPENESESSLKHKNQDKPDEFLNLRRSERLKTCSRKSYNENDYDVYSALSITSNIPKSLNEIKSLNDRNQWEKAVREELNSLKKNNTWTLVPKPSNKNIVDCKWIFTIKNDVSGQPSRYKARLVARGFSQEYLSDYNETFAPVARIASFRFLISYANQYNLLIHHMDVKTAFLNGTLKEEIYMKVPEGVKCKDNYVCKLNKALYGLKQSARCWYETFEQCLKEIGFQNSPVDRCIYMKGKGDISKNIYVILYVDDLVIACADLQTMNNFKAYLMTKFEMTDLHDIKLFLGIKIERHHDKITLDQSAYIKTVLNKFNMSDCNPINTPMELKLNYEALNADKKCDAPCRHLIGCLMYIMLCTRPDLSTCVNILSRYTNKNNKELWLCLKRVLRYIKGTIDLKLTYTRNNYNNILSGYVDSDWGGHDCNDRKSTTGYVFKLFDQNTITWCTKRQTSVAVSSTESEYMALYEAVKEALWLKSLAESINLKINKPIILYEDNNGCISIANNPTSHKRSKHIDIKYHFSREQVEKNVIKLNYISTGNQLADLLTKPLPVVSFIRLRKGLGIE